MVRYWIELHCEGGKDDELSRANNDRCQSFVNDNPGVALSSLHRAPRALAARAKAAKWTRIGNRWLCPHCAKQEKADG